MKVHPRASVLCITVIASTSLLASGALAATPPNGSYSQSCNGISFDGATLSASCSDGRGTWYSTSLLTGGCSGDIANVTGHLYCGGGEPGGSYLASCSNVSYSVDLEGSPIVSASCRDGGGVYQSTELGLRYCLDAPTNILGQLSCDQNAGNGLFSPAGSYRWSCINPFLYVENAYYWLYADCRNIQGVWIETVLDNPQLCKGDIGNSNGQLVCNR